MNVTLKLGEHLIFDLSDCNHDILMDSERAYSQFAQAVHESGLTVVEEGFYKFSPHGPNTVIVPSTFSLVRLARI